MGCNSGRCQKPLRAPTHKWRGAARPSQHKQQLPHAQRSSQARTPCTPPPPALQEGRPTCCRSSSSVGSSGGDWGKRSSRAIMMSLLSHTTLLSSENACCRAGGAQEEEEEQEEPRRRAERVLKHLRPGPDPGALLRCLLSQKGPSMCPDPLTRPLLPCCLAADPSCCPLVLPVAAAGGHAVTVALRTCHQHTHHSRHQCCRHELGKPGGLVVQLNEHAVKRDVLLQQCQPDAL